MSYGDNAHPNAFRPCHCHFLPAVRDPNRLSFQNEFCFADAEIRVPRSAYAYKVTNTFIAYTTKAPPRVAPSRALGTLPSLYPAYESPLVFFGSLPVAAATAALLIVDTPSESDFQPCSNSCCRRFTLKDYDDVDESQPVTSS